MTMQPPRRVYTTHPEELLSILFALLATVFAVVYIGLDPEWKPMQNEGFWYSGSVWLGFIYLIVQITFLLFSASQVRALGVLDSIVSVFPVIAATVMAVEGLLGHLNLSPYKWNMLSVILVAGASEFLLTIWIRFVINRRTIGFGGDG